ncbi:MAG: ABC transporter ATP-binding protein [Methanomicrobia archaeon]|nr:ABC transporter ATP-binding protein [Methanomicrobia archaeon]
MPRPTDALMGSKPKNYKKAIRRLISDLRPLLGTFIFVIIILITSATLSVLMPILLRDFMNTFMDPASGYISYDPVAGIFHIGWPSIMSRFALMMSFYVGSALLMWLADWIVVKISADYAYNMREKIKAKLDLMPLSYFDRNTYGEILSRGTNDVDNISRHMSTIINQTILGISIFIGVIIAMFVTAWQLALVAIAILPFTILFTVLIAVNSQKEFKKYRGQLGKLNSIAEENYAGFKIVKLFNKEDDVAEAFDKVNDAMMKADRKSQWLSGFIFPTMRFINNLGFIGVSIVGGFMENIGNMVSFFLFLQMFQQPFQQIGQISSIIQSVLASGERIYDLLDEIEMEPETIDAIGDESQIKGEIVFDNVDFSYSPDKPLIQNFALHVNTGDSIAIVGPTGAGKTTIVNLIMRFYEVNSGRILLDGVDIRNYMRSTLRGAVGMVLQDTWLFSGSIRDNIRYGRNDATDEEIEEAAKQAHADHFIKTLPGGYDFVLNEDGTNVSQGQRQLLTIARAIVSKPKILILDEATSSVDTRTEVAIQDAMNKMMVGRTSFIIAHRLSTIKNAKVIIVMQKGKIVEIGNHQQLLDKNGFYADLYNAQFSGRNPLAEPEKESDDKLSEATV